MGPSRRAARLTNRGAATRARIVEAAAELVRMHGAAGTSIDDILAASQTSKSQLYHYFGDKSGLILAVVQAQAEQVLSQQRPELDALDSIPALLRWRDKIVTLAASIDFAGGCPLGTLANELADKDAESRSVLQECFTRWESPLIAGLTAMRNRGDLRADADPAALTEAVMAALQGGYLLSKTFRTSRPLTRALDMAIDHIRNHTVGWPG